MNEKTRRAAIVVAAILGCAALLYLGGLLGQLFTNYNTWLTAGGMMGKVQMQSPDWNPLSCFASAFTGNGLKALLLIVGVGAVIFIYIKVHDKFSGTSYDERGFTKNKHGTYGTADWMSEKEMKSVLEVSTPEKATGMILGERKGQLICLPEDTRLNRHTAVFGASGTMKSRAVVRNALFSAIRRGESILISDPKSEMYNETSELFRKNGYEVKVLNLVDPLHSDSWNCMSDLGEDTLMAQVLTNVIIGNTSSGKGDHFWDNGEANLLKGGLVYADAITTVSPQYAKEIQEVHYGEGLDGLLRARYNDLRGILNGIDYEEFNPDTDKYICQNYNAQNYREEKLKNKRELQKQLGLEQDDNKLMIGMVTRLSEQKGLDLVAYIMDELCQDNVQIVVLGTGEERFENMLRHFDWKYGNKVSAQIYYSEEMSHKVYAASDVFLMPSLFEPCGLSQLMALRYGTVPVVRETGGLIDTVQPYNEFEGTGTGFSFSNYNAHEMLDRVRYAQTIFQDKKRDWNKIVERAMNADFSWKASAKKYEEMYDWLKGDK